MPGHNFLHFTGKKGSSKTKPKHRTTKRQRRAKRGRHKNRYKALAERRRIIYNSQDKTFRQLPLIGEPGEIIRAGTIALFHGRRYCLMEDMELKFAGMPGNFELESM